MKSVTYIVDLDGTLVDNSHREHLIPEDKGNTAAWIAFNGACEDDEPREPVRQMVAAMLQADVYVMFLTGRGEAARKPTLTSMRRMFPGKHNFHLLMRPMEDHRPAANFKLDVISEIRKACPHAEILAFEDDPDIVDAFRSVGVSVMHIESTCAAVAHKAANK